MKYEILEHKADLKIKVFGKTKEELFKNALLAMIDALQAEIKNQKLKTELPFMEAKVKKRTKKSFSSFVSSSTRRTKSSSPIKKIKIKSLNLETLLVDFLSEILYLIQVNKEIYNEIKFTKFTDTELEAEVFGQKVERFGEDIKAVTYHNLNIREREDRIWEATVLFDV